MKELRELINLPEASTVPLNPSLLATPPSNPPLTQQQSQVLQLLKQGSKNLPGTTSKSWSLHFFRSPTHLAPPSPDNPSARLSLSYTTLDPQTKRAIPTGETSTLATDLVITSLGFHAEPTHTDFYDPGLRHLRTLSGRVINTCGTTLKNVYASGWAATGAKGVLASTMMDAYGVADTIISDWQANGQNNILLDLEEPPQEVRKALKEGKVTEYADWKRIDEEEVRRGEAIGKERERMGWVEVSKFLESK